MLNGRSSNSPRYRSSRYHPSASSSGTDDIFQQLAPRGAPSRHSFPSGHGRNGSGGVPVETLLRGLNGDLVAIEELMLQEVLRQSLEQTGPPSPVHYPGQGATPGRAGGDSSSSSSSSSSSDDDGGLFGVGAAGYGVRTCCRRHHHHRHHLPPPM